MSEDTKYSVLFISVGVIALLLAFTGKKPSFGGGLVHRYASIVIGILFIIYGIVSLF